MGFKAQNFGARLQLFPYLVIITRAPLVRFSIPTLSYQLSTTFRSTKMAENIYDEIEIEDMTYDPTLEIYHYPCPCGDRFEIGIADLRDGEEIAVCPSCSLMIKVIFEVVSNFLLLLS